MSGSSLKWYTCRSNASECRMRTMTPRDLNRLVRVDRGVRSTARAASWGASIRHVDLDSTRARGFVELSQSRWVPMVRLARLVTAADPAAEELVQDAFRRVHAHWDRGDNPPSY